MTTRRAAVYVQDRHGWRMEAARKLQRYTEGFSKRMSSVLHRQRCGSGIHCSGRRDSSDASNRIMI